jgi:hypothetical protein
MLYIIETQTRTEICRTTNMNTMFYRITLFTECLKTQIRYTHTQYYVCAHVITENTLQ